MAITNLAGTTWYVPKGWLASAGYGNFDVQGVVNNKYTFARLRIGYHVTGEYADGTKLYDTYKNGVAVDTTWFANASNLTIIIVSGADVTNSSLISWLETYGELQKNVTAITYCGNTTEMENGQSTTIKCKGKKAATDIVITPDFVVEIAYGDIINEAHKGQTATLKCAGKKMKHNVVVSTYITISGTWLLNQNVDFSMLEGELIQGINGQMVNTYNYPFNKIRITPSRGTIEVYVTSSGYLTYKLVYSNGWMWNDTAIKFGDEPQEVTIDFYNWLTANATMQ